MLRSSPSHSLLKAILNESRGEMQRLRRSRYLSEGRAPNEDLEGYLSWFGVSGKEIGAPNTDGAQKLNRPDLPKKEQLYVKDEDGKKQLALKLFFKYYQLANGKFVVYISGNDGYQTIEDEAHVLRTLDKASLDAVIKRIQRDIEGEQSHGLAEGKTLKVTDEDEWMELADDNGCYVVRAPNNCGYEAHKNGHLVGEFSDGESDGYGAGGWFDVD